MTDDAPLILSASSISVYLRCGYRYLLENVYRLPGAPTMAMSIGAAVHSGVEALHKGAPRPVEATVAAFGTQLDSMVEPFEESPVSGLSAATDLLALYQAKVAPTFRPTMVERSFVVRIAGVLTSGQIDAADERSDDVRDTKTTANLSKFRPERHRFQMSIYSLAYRVLTGRRAKRLGLDVLARNGNWKSIAIEPDYNEVADVLTLTSSAIMRGEFEPTGATNGQCARCPFATTGDCTYAQID